MPAQKLAELLGAFEQHTGSSDVDSISDTMRDEIENQVQTEDAALFWGSDEGEQLREPLARVLKSAPSKAHEKMRKGARGAAG